MIVLGVAVSADLQSRWREWLAPVHQPFFVVESPRSSPKSTVRAPALGHELVDTYAAWRIDRSLKTLWLDEATFMAMPRRQRAALVRAQVDCRRGAVPSVRRWSDVLDPEMLRGQADGHRFVWWPSLVAKNPRAILSRVISAAPDGAAADALPSRHRDVGAKTWNTCAAALPDARRLAGSFPQTSGPNCFSTVMAAAGAAGEDDYVLQEPFAAWLDSACRAGGRDEDAGTVLVWRDRAGLPTHAAATIGGGWALEKASGEWWTPIAVRAVRDVVRTRRSPDARLERYRIVNSGGRGTR